MPYDVVGPICESSDCFGKDVMLNETKRGDLLPFDRQAAYGEAMASQYNCRIITRIFDRIIKLLTIIFIFVFRNILILPL